MGALAGVCHAHDAHIPAEFVNRISRAIARFGPREARRIDAGYFGTSRYETGDREEHEYQLVECAHCIGTWDGRLDNRNELLIQLPPSGKHLTDGEIALSVYLDGGLDGLGKLVGDWCFGIWDKKQRQCVLARDYWGARTLFYDDSARCLTWSTSLGALVQIRECYEDLDGHFLIADLMGLRVPTLTPYRTIRAVRAGHALKWNGDGRIETVKIWRPPVNDIRLSAGDYQDGLRAHFISSLTSRLRYSDPAWAELSGGLDSSSVACGADRLIKARAVTAPALTTISVYAQHGGASDERSYINTVEQHIGQTGEHVGYEAHAEAVNECWGWVSPRLRRGPGHVLCEMVRNSGGSFLLTGQGGDPIMGNYVSEPYDVASCLRTRHLGAALTTARARASVGRRPVYGVIVDACALLSNSARARRRRLLRRLQVFGAEKGALRERVRETWLVPNEYGALWEHEIERDIAPADRHIDLGKRQLLDYLEEVGDRLAPYSEYVGLVGTHPLTHRPLVEFILGVPVDVWGPVRRPRALMRDSFATFLPDRIRRRVAKGDPSPAFMRHSYSIAEDWLGRLERLHIVQRGFVDTDLLRKKLLAIRNSGCAQVMPLPVLIRIENWLALRDDQIASVRQSLEKGGDNHEVRQARSHVRRSSVGDRA